MRSTDAIDAFSEQACVMGVPQLVTTSGFPGEVAVSIPTPAGVVLPAGQSLGTSAVLYSTDYGVTWHAVRSTPQSATGTNAVVKLLWGHVGSASVLVALARTSEGSSATSMYVADMTAATPSFVQMTTPYAPSGQPIAVGDGADQPWLATVDSAGNLSVYPLVAQATAPAPDALAAQSGFPADPVAIGIGGATAAGVPPAGVVVMSPSAVTMSVKDAAATSYPAPGTAVSGSVSGCSLLPGQNTDVNAPVTPNTGGSYGAAWINGCWVQDTAGTITAEPVASSGAAIDAGYNATNTSPGSDAVVLLQNSAGSGGATKDAASNGGFPSGPTSPTVDAQPGTDPSSSGISIDGFTATSVFQTAFGPTSTRQVASATDAGGFVSADGGATFWPATDNAPQSVAWWQDASGNSWLLFGLWTVSPASNTVDGFQNWTSATPPVGNGSGNGNGNVSGSSPSDLGAPGHGYVQAIVGVPGQDTAFLDLAQGGNQASSSRPGVVRRVIIAAGPWLSFLNPAMAIGDGVIPDAGALAYCPISGSVSSLQDVLLVNSGSGSDGVTIYRVPGATTASPTVTQVASLPGTPMYQGQPSLQADCASGTVLAAEAGMSKTLLMSTDGGQTFTDVPTPAQDGITAVAVAPGTLGQSLVIGDGGGSIYASNNGGQTWPFVENDPGTGIGVNLGIAENASGGLRDFIAGAASPSTSANPSYGTMLDPRVAPLARRADLIAGPGEFVGNLTAPALKPAPTVTHATLASRTFEDKTDTTARLTLSEAATVTVVVTQKASGREVKGTCKANARKGKRCTLAVQKAKLTVDGAKGRNSFKFRVKSLAPGGYTASVTARSPGSLTSKPVTFAFTIKKPKTK
ncbi:MAG: WD40/YVTN/BNR-like repeat-containing protein [Solirubrobacteraceae bacterium]